MNILIIIWIVLILAGFIKKDSKSIVFLQSLYASFMIATNNGNADQQNYMNLYYQLANNFGNVFSSNANIGGNGNIGFNLIFYISSFFRQYNLSLFIISAVVMLILYKGISFYTKNVAIVFSLYLISPFIIDTVQIKNFIAAIVWIYFSRYLYLAINGKKESKTKNTFLYIVGVIIATSIHFVFSFTILYTILIFINTKNFRKFIWSLVAIFLLLFLCMRKITIIIRILASTGFPTFVTIAGKFQDYGANFNGGDYVQRNYIVLLVYIFMYIIMFFIYRSLRNQPNENQFKLLNFTFGVTLISMLIIPLMIYSSDLYRIQRNILLLVYILYAHFRNFKILILSERAKLNYINFTVSFLTVSLAVIYFYIEDIHWYYNSVFRILFRI